MIGPKKTTPKKAGIMVMVKWPSLMYKLLIVMGIMHYKDFFPIVSRRILFPNYLIFQKFQKG